MTRPDLTYRLATCLLGSLLAISCGDSSSDQETTPASSPDPGAASSVARPVSPRLLDNLPPDAESLILKAQAEARVLTEVQVSQLASPGGVLEDGSRCFFLPIPVARRPDGTPVEWEVYAGDRPIDPGAMSVIPAFRQVWFHDLDCFPAFPRPREADGSFSVMMYKDHRFDVEIDRYGVESKLVFSARFLGTWNPEFVPRIRFLIDGQEIGRLDATVQHAPEYILPPYFGKQKLTIDVSEVEAGAEKPKLSIQFYRVEDRGGLDLLKVPAGIEVADLCVRYRAEMPRTIRSLHGPKEPPVPSLALTTLLVPGPAAVVFRPPQAAQILVDGVEVARADTPVRELSFEVSEVKVVRLEVWKDAKLLSGQCSLIQPMALLRNPLKSVRGQEAEATHPLVRHVSLSDETRRSLLLIAPGVLELPLEYRAGATFEFELGSRHLEDASVSLDPVHLKMTLVGAEEVVIADTDVPADSVWRPVRMALPDPPAQLRALRVELTPAPRNPVASLLQLVALASPRIVPTHDPSPHLLIYLIDTLRPDHLGCYGYDRNTSPHIDALAADGVVFENAYSHAPWTRPSVATLFTGLLYSFHGAGKTSGLEYRLETLAELMRQSGRETAAFIANAQIHSLGLNFTQGFQRFTGVEKVVGNSRADHVNELVLPWLESKADRPFFLYVHTIDPHAKYDPPMATAGTFNKGYDGKLAPRLTGSRLLADQTTEGPLSARDLQYVHDLYDEEILFNDQEFGKLVQLLKDRGLYENTLIVVLSDHGEEFGEHGAFGHGGRLWEELLRVPLVVKLPGPDRPRGVRVPQRVRMLDLLATLSACLAVDWDPSVQMGVDMTAAWNPGQTFDALDIIAEEEPGLRTLIRGDYKIIQKDPEISRRSRTWLFDLGKDPGEQNDLSESRPELVEEYAAHLMGILATYREQGFRQREEGLAVQLSAEALDALRELGYLDDAPP